MEKTLGDLLAVTVEALAQEAGKRIFSFDHGIMKHALAERPEGFVPCFRPVSRLVDGALPTRNMENNKMILMVIRPPEIMQGSGLSAPSRAGA